MPWYLYRISFDFLSSAALTTFARLIPAMPMMLSINLILTLPRFHFPKSKRKTFAAVEETNGLVTKTSHAIRLVKLSMNTYAVFVHEDSKNKNFSLRWLSKC